MNQIPAGETRPLPNEIKQVYTSGVMHWLKEQGREEKELWQEVILTSRMHPAVVTDGGNDKYFFSMTFYGQKFFAAANEVGGLTVMLPEEY